MARASEFRVFRGDRESAAQVAVVGQRAEPFSGGRRERCSRAVEEIRVGLLGASAHATPELMQLREAVALGIGHNERIHAGNINAVLQEGGADEEPRAAFQEADEGSLQVRAPEAPVKDFHRDTGKPFLDLSFPTVQIFNAVVQKEYLPAAVHLPSDGLPESVFMQGSHIGANGLSAGWWCAEEAHILEGNQGLIEGSGDRRSGEH